MTAQPARLFRRTSNAASAPVGSTLTRSEMAIAESVLYASLFDYPLTLAQLRQSLIESTQTPSEILQAYDCSPALQRVIEYHDGFFFPVGRANLIDERKRREARSRAFLRRHGLFLSLVCAIPYVKMVALSGSIAHLNLEGDGDLDLFIVTRGRRVWATTVAAVLLAKLLRRRRIVCANFVLADSRLSLEQQDLFTASQIVHLKPLIGRDVFQSFVAANPFVVRFYPNFHDAGSPPLPFHPMRRLTGIKRAAEAVLALPWRGLEWSCRVAYRSYLRRKSSSWDSPDQVKLDDDCLKLHTHSHRQSVMERFERVVSEAFQR
jgi:hypothetical protein